MPIGRPGGTWAPMDSLPRAALQRIFELLCNSCPPDVPGTCWLEPVCKQWRVVSGDVKGLRVLFHGHTQQQVDSFCSWLPRHVGRVKALAITSSSVMALPVVAALAAAAAAAAAAPAVEAAAGAEVPIAAASEAPLPPPATAAAAAAAAAACTPLPLERLVIIWGELLLPGLCQDVVRPLLGALPHLQHLHLPLEVPEAYEDYAALSSAAAEVLEPLQHSTCLTSLVLNGPRCHPNVFVTEEAHAQLLSSLPPTLRSLTWDMANVDEPDQLSFDHLTGLTHLSLRGCQDMQGALPDDAFTGLGQLRKLELLQIPVSEQALLGFKEQLVALQPASWVTPWIPQEDLTQPLDLAGVLPKLTQLRSLELEWYDPVPQLLQAAPPLQQLRATCEEVPADDACGGPWVLQHYPWRTQLQKLDLYLATPSPGPGGLCALTQLKQLSIYSWDIGSAEPLLRTSWAVAVAGLVNLEVLTLPVGLTESCTPWLTGLTRLVVLEVSCCDDMTNAQCHAAAAHISQLLATDPGSSSSRVAGVPQQSERVQVVCFGDFDCGCSWVAGAQLHAAVAAAVPVLPPNRHMFRGCWWQLRECGVELWPAPVAARLRQLLLV